MWRIVQDILNAVLTLAVERKIPNLAEVGPEGVT
jgi:hypothetical protein